MASYRPYPPQSSFGPSTGQNPIPPPPAQPSSVPTQQRGGGGGGGGGNQYNQNWSGYGGDGSVPPAPASSYPQNYNQVHQSSNHHQQHYGPPRSQHPPPPPLPHQSYPYAPQPPPPPPPDSSYPPPPPPPPPGPSQPSHLYHPSSHYSQGNQNQQSMQPPPPPSSPPPSSSIPPPPPPTSPPPPSAPKQKAEGSNIGAHRRDKGVPKDPSFGRRERDNSYHDKHQRHSVPPIPPKKINGPSGRMETEDEKRLRKKREFEKQRQDERHRHHLKESQNTILQKTQMLSTGKGQGSIVGSRMGERKATPFLSGERIENRLKKPTTFLCKLKFRNELPDTSAQPKLTSLRKEKDHYTRYTITSLEKTYKPQLYVEPDLGIPLDLLDLSVYNPPSVRTPLALEDEELLRDDALKTPVKKDGIKRKDRPTDKGVAWLVKTQYISPLSIESTKQSLTEKQAKELREMKGGRNILQNLNNRGRKIKEIEASFEACKSRPVHATNKNLHPVEVLPLLPDFDRYDDPFVVVAFDSAPTADSETFNKLNQSVREAHESQAIMKSYMATGSDPTKPEKFLAYMVPSPDELSKDIYDEQEDVSYSWVREYHWDVRGDNVDDPTTYLVSFDDAEAHYVPLPTKLVLRKKRAREGRSSDEVEHFPAPARVTVRRRSTVATLEVKDPEVYSNSKRGSDIEDGLGRSHKHDRHQDMDQYSGAEDEMSD